MTEEPRSFSEKCLSDLATVAASQPETAAGVARPFPGNAPGAYWSRGCARPLMLWEASLATLAVASAILILLFSITCIS